MKKQIIAGMAAAMVCVGAVGGTFAYLTQITDEVTNTFTVGENVGITLDEAKVTELGVAVTPEERTDHNEYKLIPGHTYTKDPTVTVNTGTADCYVFVHVENGISDIEGEDTIASQIEGRWTETDIPGYYYWKEGVVEAGDELIVFESFTVDEEATIEDLNDYANARIIITACAVQADGFANAEEAMEALPAGFFAK